MVDHDDAAEMAELTAWAQQAAKRFGLEPMEQRDVDSVLSCAADVSAHLVRSAGPVAMFLAGFMLATGRAPDVTAACQLVSRLLHNPGLTGVPDEIQHTRQGLLD